VAIEKSFPGTKALDDVSVEFLPGEIHGILGENGAGKTTLMRVLAGLLRPDAGEVLIRGERVELRGRRDGAAKGIGFVQQQLTLIDELTGSENFLLGHPRGRRVLDLGSAERALADQGRRIGITIDPRRRASELSMEERQRLEILIALAWGAEILVLDEPTSSLGTADVEALSEVLRSLAAQGTAIVYISHKLPEVLVLAHRITLMRRGRVVARHLTEEVRADPERVAREMVGALPPRLTVPHDEVGDTVIELRAVCTARTGGRVALKDVDLLVRGKEVVGVAGVAGGGQLELAHVLVGLTQPSTGTVDPRPSRSAYVPEDRAEEGLALYLPISDNAIVLEHRTPPLRASGGWLVPGEIRRFVWRLLDAFGIGASDVQMPTAALSGGNQQRLVIGRELFGSPDLVVAHNPTAGLDVAAAAGVHRKLIEVKHEGAGVVLISPDLEELMAIADRLVVLFEGRIVGAVRPEQTDTDEIGRLMTGVSR
jgi:ABC-type uncharacterized transport system ATPase subunit